jgi:hypothetical protein
MPNWIGAQSKVKSFPASTLSGDWEKASRNGAMPLIVCDNQPH